MTRRNNLARKKKSNVTLSDQGPKEIKPPVDPGYISFSLSAQELQTLINLLSLSSKTYEHLASAALKEENQDSYKEALFRAQYAALFANKFTDLSKMPEPTSRNIH
jgi:hypothetical protein